MIVFTNFTPSPNVTFGDWWTVQIAKNAIDCEDELTLILDIETESAYNDT